MSTLVFGGAGFVGLNITESLLAEGKPVVVFDRLALPAEAAAVFRTLPGRLQAIAGDVLDPVAVGSAFTGSIDCVVLGSAVTADAAREARDPETILQVNLMALTILMRACRTGGVRRIVNLSSAAAYGSTAMDVACVTEDMAPQPVGLYGITKFSSEMVLNRLAQLWQMDLVNLRLSAAFGPWERATGVRDTTSAPFQITEAARSGQPALLARPGVRDWIYAPDVAQAVTMVLRAPVLRHRLYNVSSPHSWPALAWGQHLATLQPGLECRLAREGETPTIDFYAQADRAPLSVDRLHKELGWQARFGMADSAEHLQAWLQRFNPITEEST
jgi:UDP-glucose 4-epimerase